MSTTVGTKGQVTIEKELREALGVRPGWRVPTRRRWAVGRYLPPPKHSDSLLGILADKTDVRIPPSELEAAIEHAWEGSVREKYCSNPKEEQ